MNERLNRAVAKLREEGLAVSFVDDSQINVGGYLLTYAELLELMDNDKLTWQSIKDLRRKVDHSRPHSSRQR